MFASKFAVRVGAVSGLGAVALYKTQSPSAAQPKCLAVKRDGVLAFGGASGVRINRPGGPALVPETQALSLNNRASPYPRQTGGPFGNPAHDWDYYQKCMVGGILSVRGGGGGAVLAPAALARPVFFHQPPTHKTRTHTTPIWIRRSVA